MNRLILTTLLLIALGGLGNTAAAADQNLGYTPRQNVQQGQDTQGYSGKPARGLAQTGGENPAQIAGGDIEVVKGKIDKWNQEGEMATGGFLGLGETKLRVTPQTLILNADGHKVGMAALKPGREVASIYRKDNKSRAPGYPGALGRTPNKIALVVVLRG